MLEHLCVTLEQLAASDRLLVRLKILGKEVDSGSLGLLSSIKFSYFLTK